MAGPGGSEVGRVAIRVLPDTSAFGRSLERYLKRVEATLRIQVPTEADVSGIREDVERIREETEKNPVDIPVKAQMDDFQRRVLADVKRLSKTIELDIPLTVDGEEMRRDLAAKVAEVERLTRIEIPVDIQEAAALRAKITAAVAEVEAFAKAQDPEIEVDVRVNRQGLVDLSGVGATIGRISTQALGLGSRVAGIGSGIALWGTLLASVIGLVGVLAPAFALILPVVAGLAIGLGVMVAAADGLKKAFAPLVQQFKALAPALADTVSRGVEPLVRQLAPGLVRAMAGSLQRVAAALNATVRSVLTFVGSAPGLDLIRQISASVGVSFEALARVAAPLTKAFLQITASALPAFRLMTSAAEASAVRFAEWADRVTSSGAAARAIFTATQALGSVLRITGQLVSVLVRSFISLAPIVISVAESVGRLVADLASMTAPVVRFVAANKELAAVLATIGLALAVTFGGPITAIVAAVILAARVFDLLRGRIGTIADSMRPLIEGFQSLTASLRSGFNTVVPALITFAQAVGPVLQDLGRNLVSTVGPALASLGTTIETKVAPAIARFLVAIAPLAAAFAKTFGTAVIAAIRATLQVIEQLGVILAGVLDILTGILTGDWASLWQGAKNVVAGFASGVVAILRASLLLPSVQMFRQIVATILGFFANLGTSIASAVVGALSVSLSAISNLFATVGTSIVGFFAGLGTAVAGAFASVVAAVAGVASTIATVLATALRATVGVLSAIWSQFWSSTFGQLVRAGLDLVVALVRLQLTVMAVVFASIIAAVVGVVRVGFAAIQAVVSAVMSAVVAVVTTTWRAASAVVSATVTAVRSAVTAGFNAVVAVVRSTMAATQAAVSAAWGAIRPFVQGAVAAVVAAVRGISVIVGIVGNAFRSAYQAAAGWVGNLISLVASLGSRIVGALGSFGSLLYSAGQSLIQGLINGIMSKIAAVTSAINSVTSKIRGFFPGSPVKEGPLRVFNNGQTGRELIEMLAKGLEDSAPVDAAVDRLTARIASVTSGAAMSAGRLAPSLAAAGGGITVHTYNPAPETPSETVTRSMRKLALLGP